MLTHFINDVINYKPIVKRLKSNTASAYIGLLCCSTTYLTSTLKSRLIHDARQIDRRSSSEHIHASKYILILISKAMLLRLLPFGIRASV